MKVLLVGAAGFLGRYVHAQLLEQGHHVIASATRPPDPASVLAETLKDPWVIGDLGSTDWDAHASGVEAVICTAASLASGDQIADWTACVAANIVGLSHLFFWSQTRDVQRFVLTSSAGLYRRPVRQLPVTEDAEIRPLRPYWTSKLMGEQLIFSSDVGSRLVPWALRLSSPYGIGQAPNSVLPKFIQSVRNGQNLVVMGKGLRSQDFIRVEDAAKAHVACLTATPLAMPVPLNLGSGEETTLTDLASMIIRTFGSGSETLRFNHEDGSDSDRFVLDIAQTKAVLGLQPMPIADGLAALRETLA
jgi:nucleoside-diphosphate-sugar epimerase